MQISALTETPKTEFCAITAKAESLCHLLIMMSSTTTFTAFMFMILCAHFLKEEIIVNVNVTRKTSTKRCELKSSFLISNNKFQDKLKETM